MASDERQARIDQIRARLDDRLRPCTINITQARWLLGETERLTAELAAAQARAERAEAVRVAYRAWEDALDEFYGDSVEYAGWMDRVDALRKSARAALAGGQGEG